MNEHIKQLAEQAGLVRNGDIGMKRWEGPRSDSISDQDLEKFAELIVQECAQVSEDDITDGDACCTNTADRIARQIKKHFGVEE